MRWSGLAEPLSGMIPAAMVIEGQAALPMARFWGAGDTASSDGQFFPASRQGEAHHALKNALRIGRQGEIRDRTAEGQHYRMAGLNLLAHISPLGWAHILLTGEYRWPKR